MSSILRVKIFPEVSKTQHCFCSPLLKGNVFVGVCVFFFFFIYQYFSGAMVSPFSQIQIGCGIGWLGQQRQFEKKIGGVMVSDIRILPGSLGSYITIYYTTKLLWLYFYIPLVGNLHENGEYLIWQLHPFLIKICLLLAISQDHKSISAW